MIVALAYSSFALLAPANASGWYLNCNPDNNVPYNTGCTFTGWTTYSGDCKVEFTLKCLQTGYTCSHEEMITWKNGEYCGDWSKILDHEGDWRICTTFYKKTTFLWWTTWDKVYECTPKIITCCCPPSNNYWLDCNPPCGSEVQPGTLVTSTAKTTNSEIYKVKFTWTNPLGQEVTETVTNRQWDSVNHVYYFVSTRTLDIIGDWCVKAEFIDKQGYCGCQKDVVVACRYQCLTVVPEIPLLGTVGASAAMLSGFALKIKRKQKK
jgi:hypothetical protein